MNIPLIDLKAQYNSIGSELNEVALEVLSSANYIMGKNVSEFEKEFANYVGAKHAISVGNGTDALVVTLKALGIEAGDEVITSTFTFFATAESISAVGAVPVFVDVLQDTFNIDPTKIEEKITSKTKAIMPVHIFGQSADMDAINDIAKRHNLVVIEDACQAIGGTYKGRNVGTLGDAACFSFFPTKNLGCAGDGGMIVTSDDKVATIARALKAHGSGENGQKAYNLLNNITEEVAQAEGANDTVYNPLKYYNYLIGYNTRLDAIQAAILRVKIKQLDAWNAKRREIASIYDEALKDTKLVTPVIREDVSTAYHMYILQSEERAQIIEKLTKANVATGVYYPVPLHLQKVYKSLGYKEGDMPVAEYLSNRTFAIPVYPELTEEQISYVIESIKK